MTFYVPDTIKKMDRGDLAQKLHIDWVEAERLQKGLVLPSVFFVVSSETISEILDIPVEEVNKMVNSLTNSNSQFKV